MKFDELVEELTDRLATFDRSRAKQELSEIALNCVKHLAQMPPTQYSATGVHALCGMINDACVAHQMEDELMEQETRDPSQLEMFGEGDAASDHKAVRRKMPRYVGQDQGIDLGHFGKPK